MVGLHGRDSHYISCDWHRCGRVRCGSERAPPGGRQGALGRRLYPLRLYPLRHLASASIVPDHFCRRHYAHGSDLLIYPPTRHRERVDCGLGLSIIRSGSGWIWNPNCNCRPLTSRHGLRPCPCGRPAACWLPLVGHIWLDGIVVYMGALTAGLGRDDLVRYASNAGLALAVNMLLAGVFVCLLHGGIRSLRREWRDSPSLDQ